MKQAIPNRNLPDSAHWFIGFAAMLALLPLPFGSNRPWASDLFAIISAILLLGMVWQQYRNPAALSGKPPVKRVAASAIMFALVVLWSIIQIVPWTPTSWHHPLWSAVNDPASPYKGSISIDPGTFLESILRMLGYAACFLMAFWGGRNEDKAKLLLKVLVYSSLAYAIYGLFMQAFDIEYVLWFKKWAYKDVVTSTFINKNSYATYAGMGLLGSLALLWQRFKRFELKDKKLAKKSKLAALLQQLSAMDVFYFILPLILLGSIVLTGSRAGLFSIAIGCFIFLAALAINRKWKTRIWIIAGISGAIFLLISLHIGGDMLISRSATQQISNDATTRGTAYALVTQQVMDNPVFGYGLGTFNNAFRLYRDRSLDLWFQHAHNDYLEAAIELGLPATILLITSILLLIGCCIEGILKRKKSEIFPILGLSVSTAVGIHSIFDFGMQIPAIAATYFAILGLGVAQSWSVRE
ncbi:MAG: O-antigen ligase family protein [Alphaproteobacteria bacterium]|nr:O-antigen ligase family protein [Alphaproteobacteria bacterium]